MQTKLVVSSSPFLRDASVSTRRLMGDVVIALIPTALAAIWFFGAPALALMLVSVVFAVLSELVYEKITHQKTTIDDLSAVVTGLLLAFNLPANAPWWMAAIGSIIAIVLVKQMFGGIGQNFVNPALTARIILMTSFPSRMTTWTAPFAYLNGTDGATTATPLALSAQGATDSLPSYLDMFLGVRGGCLGETCTLALLLGGIYLIARRVISPVIPVCYLGTAAVMSLLLGRDVLFDLMAGGLMLGAIFMATDYTTSPITFKGKIIYAVGCGVLTMLIRVFGSLPEGVSFSIVILNILVPLIERVSRPKPFGKETVKQ